MKALKIFGIFMLILIAIVVLSMLVVPHFYKDRIADIAKREINKQLTAEVDFGDFDLSLFRNFPNFSLGLHDFTVVNMPSDTLFASDGIYITVGLFSVLKDEKIEVKSITINQAYAKLAIDEDGESNWNILKDNEQADNMDVADSASYVLMLNKVLVSEATIIYNDATSALKLSMKEVNGALKGKFTEDRAGLDLNLNSPEFTLSYDDVTYLQKTDFQFDAKIDANMKDEIYTLSNNTLKLNGLKINFEGSVAFVDDHLNLLLTYHTPDNSFKQLLSLVPLIYEDGYDKLVTGGQFSMEGYIKGMYTENEMPDFKLQMNAIDAEISYPEMPSNLSNIDFDMSVEKKGNALDNTIINIEKLNGSLGNDEFQLSLLMHHLFSDPHIDLNASVGLSFENLKTVFPQESLKDVTGKVMADFNLKGKLSAVEKRDYKNFRAMGSMVCDNIFYRMDEKYTIVLNHAQFNFSPSYIDIISFNSDINQNQLEVDGRIHNYLNYFLKDEEFKANINLRSKAINIDKLLEPWSSSDEDNSGEQSEENVTYVPDNIDVLVNITSDTLAYGSLLFTDFNSEIHIHDGKIVFEDMGSSFLGGLVSVNGYYEATSTVSPHIDMDIDFQDLMVTNAYKGMSLFSKFTPIAEKAVGLFDLSLSLNMNLDDDLNPVWSSILGNGDFTSEDIELKANEVISQISDLLNVDLFENPSTGPIDLSFKIMDGKIFHKPFNVSFNDIKMEVGGWTGFDQQIEYSVVVDLPLELLGREATEKIKNLGSNYGINLDKIQSIRPVFKIDGYASKPKVTLVAFENTTAKNIKDIVEDKIEEVVNEYLEEASKEADRILAEAQAEADSIVAAAQKRADQAMKLARQTVADTKKEAQKQADKLVQEAAKKGPLAELAAKKAGEELMKNADKEAQQVLSKAQNEADKMMEDARLQAESVMQRALEKADKIRE